MSLVSGGFSTDFERTNGGFSDAHLLLLMTSPGWEHGTLARWQSVLNDNCNTGNECWGTNIYDFDNDYTTDDNGAYSASMVTPAMEVDPGAFIAKFSSWHGFHYNVSGSNLRNYLPRLWIRYGQKLIIT